MVTPFVKALSPGMLGGVIPGFYGYPIGQSCRFNDDDTPYLGIRTADVPDDTDIFSFSVWVKRGNLSLAEAEIYGTGAAVAAASTSRIYFDSSDYLYINFSDGTDVLRSTRVFRDVTNWYHIFIVVDTSQATEADRVSMYINGTEETLVSVAGYPAQNDDTKFNGENQVVGCKYKSGVISDYFDGYMAEMHFIDGLSQAYTDFGEFKEGVWIPKQYTGSYGTNGFYLKFDNDDDTSDATFTDLESSESLDGWHNGANAFETCTATDFSGLVLVNSAGTGNALASADNDVSEYDFGAIAVGEVYKFTCNCVVNSGSLDADDLMVYLVDADGGNINSTKVDIVEGTNECYLTVTAVDAVSYLNLHAAATDVDVTLTLINFHKMGSDAFGWDSSGNTNHFGSVGLVASNDERMETSAGAFETGDQIVDSPTNNYATLNVIRKYSDITFTEGNLEANTNAANYTPFVGTIKIPDTGKWYWEFACDTTACCAGIMNNWFPHRSNGYPGSNATTFEGYGYYAFNGTLYHSGASPAYGDSYGNGDYIGVAINMDSGEITFYKNGVSQGAESIDTGAGFEYIPAWSDANGAANVNLRANFGQHSFRYAAPAGYNTLCSANLPDPSLGEVNPNVGFDTILYTGDAATPRSITGLNFTPDLIWSKNRDAAANHGLADSVRGTGVDKVLNSDGTAAEADDGGVVDSFDNGGFTTSVGTANHSWFNTAAQKYVAWCWKEDPAYGFDIVSYTGTGVAHAESHNLGAVPELIIVKSRDSALNWIVYHHHALNKTDPETDYGLLNTTAAWADAATVWDDTAPTSTEFTLGTGAGANTLDDEYIAYLWRSIEGFSKVFSYEGNGNADGPFVHCGFRPKFVLIKDADAAQSWLMYDTERSTYNPIDDYLLANSSTAETTSANYEVDILSNGFKVRDATGALNTSAKTHIGIAFAEQPFKYSNAR